MHIREQNAALIVRRPALADFVQFEVFEVQPRIRTVMETEGKLVCSYPGPAIQVPVETFMDECFLRELSSFLVQMDVDHFQSDYDYDSAHPRYISELLVGILRGYGQPAVVHRITKRIGDEVLSRYDHRHPWRRSPLWLILKVSLQSSLLLSNLYKPFLLFFHAHLLRSCVRQGFSSDLLFTMRAKMARRLSKLGPDLSHHVYQSVHDTAKETEALLSNRWSAFQDIESTSPILQLQGLDFVADSRISLDKSYEYLMKVLRSPSHGFSPRHFILSQESRLYDVHDFTQYTNGRLAKAIAKDPRIAIADFELSVERNLESWVTASIDNDDAPDVIVSCIQQYFSGAEDLYEKNPEDNSIMILTIMDLWAALDRITIRECPLLKEYSPEIPSDFLHCLLLHRSSALKRALRIEEYLCQRSKEALKVPSIFSNRVDGSCFAVKYFHASKSHHRLYDKICTHARRERAAKRAKLVSLNKKSKSLLDKASKMGHRQSKDNFGHGIHSANCKKCKLELRAGALLFRIHTWPLPTSTTHAQLVVFELSPPRAFSAWRDITYMILRDIGRPRDDGWPLNRPASPTDCLDDL